MASGLILERALAPTLAVTARSRSAVAPSAFQRRAVAICRQKHRRPENVRAGDGGERKDVSCVGIVDAPVICLFRQVAGTKKNPRRMTLCSQLRLCHAGSARSDQPRPLWRTSSKSCLLSALAHFLFHVNAVQRPYQVAQHRYIVTAMTRGFGMRVVLYRR